MYKNTKTWNPFVGCLFRCVYCKPTFQAQLKRRKHACMDCYNYVPHTHPERLKKIPSARNIFVCGDGDISFCPMHFTCDIIETIRKHTLCNRRNFHKTFYFQSKNPSYFAHFEFPQNVVLLTTLETNRNICHPLGNISYAPQPYERARDFLKLPHPHKALTIEPIIDFDLKTFLGWIQEIKPEFVYIGFNTRPKAIQLPEPPLKKVKEFIFELSKFTEVRPKNLRGARLTGYEGEKTNWI